MVVAVVMAVVLAVALVSGGRSAPSTCLGKYLVVFPDT